MLFSHGASVLFRLFRFADKCHYRSFLQPSSSSPSPVSVPPQLRQVLPAHSEGTRPQMWRHLPAIRGRQRQGGGPDHRRGLPSERAGGAAALRTSSLLLRRDLHPPNSRDSSSAPPALRETFCMRREFKTQTRIFIHQRIYYFHVCTFCSVACQQRLDPNSVGVQYVLILFLYGGKYINVFI